MPYKEEQPTLMGFLGIPAVAKDIKTRFFGGPYVRLIDYYFLVNYLYMAGAVLGRARRDNITELAKMLTLPGAEVNKFIGFLQEKAKELLDKFRSDVGKEPDRFDEFILFHEFEVGTGISLTGWFGDKKKIRKMRKAFEKKCPIKSVEPYIKTFGNLGIGFGSLFPELTEKMYRNNFNNIDTDVWAEMRAFYLAIPEKQTIVSLEEVEEAVLQMVAAYTSEYYPELLDPLDLRSHLHIIGSDC